MFTLHLRRSDGRFLPRAYGCYRASASMRVEAA